MKSHAMKARAEAEAKAQVDAQMAAQTVQTLAAPPFPNGTINLGNLPATLQGLTQGITQGMSPNAQLNAQNLTLTQARELSTEKDVWCLEPLGPTGTSGTSYSNTPPSTAYKPHDTNNQLGSVCFAVG